MFVWSENQIKAHDWFTTVSEKASNANSNFEEEKYSISSRSRCILERGRSHQAFGWQGSWQDSQLYELESGDLKSEINGTKQNKTKHNSYGQ
jgi:hypothetical protein